MPQRRNPRRVNVNEAPTPPPRFETAMFQVAVTASIAAGMSHKPPLSQVDWGAVHLLELG